MDQNPNSTPSGETPKDLVAIDRHSLKQLLSAVTSTIEASINLEKLKLDDSIDKEQLAGIADKINSARESLIFGVKQIEQSVDALPKLHVANMEAQNGD